MKYFFLKGKKNNLFQNIVNISTIVALILQCITVPKFLDPFIPVIAYIVIGFALLSLILNIKNKRGIIWSRKKLIKKTKQFMTNSTGTTVMFGGDLSWTDDYIDTIRELSNNSQTVEIFFPLEKMNSATNDALDIFKKRVRILKSAGAKVYSIKKDYGLRCTLIGLYPEHENADFIFISSKRISRNPQNPNKSKYKTELLETSNIEEKKSCNSIYLTYTVLKATASLY